jgi:hypothetical protein
MLARAWITLVCALGAGAQLSCATPPGAQAIVGPTGQPMAHVHCGADQGQCFRIAGELCPKGYDIQAVLSGADGNFLVRCHAAPIAVNAAPAAGVAPTPTPIASMPTPGLTPPAAPPARTAVEGPREEPAPQAWPPATEPGPASNPWAERDKGATAGASGKSTPIDIGY